MFFFSLLFFLSREIYWFSCYILLVKTPAHVTLSERDRSRIALPFFPIGYVHQSVVPRLSYLQEILNLCPTRLCKTRLLMRF